MTTAPAPDASEDLTLRALHAVVKRKGSDRHAERAFLDATEGLALCCAAAWERRRQQGTTAEQLSAEIQKAHSVIHELRDWLAILSEHITDREPRRRHHYSPKLRFRILEHQRRFLLRVEETASRFHVTSQTVYNWLAELRENPEAQTIGSLLKPTPPVRRFADVVRRLCRQMEALGFGGKQKIAETLAQHSWKVSARSVGRFLNEKPCDPAPSAPSGLAEDQPAEIANRPTTVRGDYPNHLVLMDITRVPLIFKWLYVHVAVVLDAFSRLPLAHELFLCEPSGPAMVALLGRAIRDHGRPRHLVTDHGPQFTSDEFRGFVTQQGLLPRYGAVGEFHSIGLIDRFFRTLKESLSLRFFRPWNPRELKRRLAAALVHYAYVRPHTSLEGRTPIEAYYGIRGHLPRPVAPPRGRAGEPGPGVPFDFVFLDSEHRALPILVPRAA